MLIIFHITMNGVKNNKSDNIDKSWDSNPNIM